MPANTITSHPELVPPPGFIENPDSMDTREEQIAAAIAEAQRQVAPVTSFENVPKVEVLPKFNPSNAPESEIYVRGRQPHITKNGYRLKSEQTDGNELVEVWRLVERERVEDGTGLVSSRVLHTGSVGDLEHYDHTEHYHSHHEQRLTDPDRLTPYVSFSTDPEYLAKNLILMKGFGVRDGRESVVVRALVAPDRVLTGANNKEPEVVLVGGLAPEEYQAAYSVEDFTKTLASNAEIHVPGEGMLDREKALGYWALHA